MLRFVNAWVTYPLAERASGRRILSKARELARQLRQPFSERRRRAQAHLAEQLARAGANVPYYRDLFAEHRFESAKLARDINYLQDLPYLTKDIIREQGPRLFSRRFDIARLHARKTGGSTGPSAVIYYSSPALDWTAAINLVSLAEIGKRRYHTEAHLSSRFPEQFPWRDRLREHVKCLALNRTNLVTDSFDAAGMRLLWQALRRARPYLLQGHPSTVYALAVHLRNAGIDGRGVMRIFASTGEMLDDKKRATIETVFGCRVVDRFGNAEFGVLAWEPGRQVVPPAESWLQLCDLVAWPEQCEHASGTPELVLTSLANEAMPLVRYRTGDLARLETTPAGYRLTNLLGRVHDLVQIGGRSYPTHYVQDLLDRIGGIDEFQMQQRANTLLLRLVVPDQQRHVAIRQQLAVWWGRDVELEFTDFQGLARQGWREKFRYLVDADKPADAAISPLPSPFVTNAAA